jgi:hypothetical protein
VSPPRQALNGPGPSCHITCQNEGATLPAYTREPHNERNLKCCICVAHHCLVDPLSLILLFEIEKAPEAVWSHVKLAQATIQL